MKFSRRDFIATTAIGAAGFALDPQAQAATQSSSTPSAGAGKKPIIICAHNGYNYLNRGFALLSSGGDTLDAVVAAVTIVEDDPNDDSVGYGGLPNEEGVVELDASVMHGPTRRAGSAWPS